MTGSIKLIPALASLTVFAMLGVQALPSVQDAVAGATGATGATSSTALVTELTSTPTLTTSDVIGSFGCQPGVIGCSSAPPPDDPDAQDPAPTSDPSPSTSPSDPDKSLAPQVSTKSSSGPVVSSGPKPTLSLGKSNSQAPSSAAKNAAEVASEAAKLAGDSVGVVGPMGPPKPDDILSFVGPVMGREGGEPEASAQAEGEAVDVSEPAATPGPGLLLFASGTGVLLALIRRRFA